MLNAIKLSQQLNSITVFRQLNQDPTYSKLKAYIDILADAASETTAKVRGYTDFVHALYLHNADLGTHILNALITGNNVLHSLISSGNIIHEYIQQSANKELQILNTVANLSAQELMSATQYTGYLPQYTSQPIDIPTKYNHHLDNCHTLGYGIFARYHAFVFLEGALVPVTNPDPVTLQELSGYEDERQEVIDNTLALLDSKPASHVLLYGDSGTGKSSTVKAIFNKYRHNGLRLIELRKNQLHNIQQTIDSLSMSPLKFILFIDDLSFNENDNDYAALKAILQGSVAAPAQNIAIYATSNRRHLIKEYFSDRKGDEIHFNDTIAELTSLSDRFGLTVTFASPNRHEFNEIVKDLHTAYNLKTPLDIVLKDAEMYTHHRRGRSPRIARQFIEHLKSRE